MGCAAQLLLAGSESDSSRLVEKESAPADKESSVGSKRPSAARQHVPSAPAHRTRRNVRHVMLETEPDQVSQEVLDASSIWFSLVSLLTAKDVGCILLVLAIALVSKILTLIQ